MMHASAALASIPLSGAPTPYELKSDFHNLPSSELPRQPLDRGTDMFHNGTYARRVRANSRNVLWDNREVAVRYKEVLHATYEGDSSKHKRAAEDHGSSPRAAENWFSGDNAATLAGFLRAY